MTQQAKKMAAPNKKRAPFNVVSGIEKNVQGMERGNLETVMQAANSCNRVAGELAGVYSANVNSCIESGTKATHTAQTISNELAETCNQAVKDYVQFTKELSQCRSFQDVISLQSKTFMQMLDQYFTELEKLSTIAIEGVNAPFSNAHRASSRHKPTSKKMAA